jgi:glucose/arabinose dehydrogenase
MTLRAVASLWAGFVCAGLAAGQSVPAGFAATPLATGLGNVTCLAVAPDGRVFIGIQGGAIRVYKAGTLLATPFYTFTVNSSGERGVIGLAFDPDFASNGNVFVHISRATPTIGGSIMRLTASPPSADVAPAGSAVQIFDVGTYSAATNHVGGGMHFGLDGKLYIGVGDNANSANAQSLSTCFGKFLRINADGSIPADNPTSFAGLSGAPTGNQRAIWAVGLRNPFTSGIHPDTGRLHINDVGNSAWEEINVGAAGRNYGWPTTEGDFSQPAFPNFTRPLYTYSHSVGFAIAGGVFFVPVATTFPPAYYDQYFFADYVNGWIKTLDWTTGTASDFATGFGGIVDLGRDAAGRLLVLTRLSTGRLYQVEYTTAQGPAITQAPTPLTVYVGDPAVFTVRAAGTPVPTFQWQRDNADLGDGGGISGAQTPTLAIAGVTLADAGTYTVNVSNAAGAVTSTGVDLTVVLAGDVNCNGVLGFDDINPFVLRLTNPAGYAAAYPACSDAHSDVNRNGVVGFDDINPFVTLLTGP